MAEVAVVGAGYLGLVTGASLALIGHRVTCVDRDVVRVAGLREGRLPVYGPGLEELVARGVGAGRLSFAYGLVEAVGRADVAFIRRDLGALGGKRVALLGLAFKPNTDDLREAPSLRIAAELRALGADVVGYDPVAGKAASKIPDLRVAFDPYEALDGAHAAVVVTEWEEVRNPSTSGAASLMLEPKLLMDGPNAVDPAAASATGLLHGGFGHG